MPKKVILKINGSKPEQLSLSRLSEYLRTLTDLYGSEGHVYFKAVEEGSAELVSHVDDTKYHDVANRLRDAHEGLSSKKTQDAYKKINHMIHEDGVGGEVLIESAKIIQFPKHDPNTPLDIHISQTGHIQGRLYNVGGKDDTVPVRLESANGTTYMCTASVDIAMQLAPLLFSHVRLEGKGAWERKDDGIWHLQKFIIHSFEKLQDTSLKESVSTLKDLTGLRWDEMDDPHGELDRARH